MSRRWQSLTIAVVLLAAPTPASALTVSSNGAMTWIASAPGESAKLTVDGSPAANGTQIRVGSQGPLEAGMGCSFPNAGTVACDVSAPALVLANLGDGDDEILIQHGAPMRVEVVGGPGNDRLSALSGLPQPAVVATFLDGGAGYDSIVGWAGDDELSGGPGDDDVLGVDGDDRVDGGAQTDRLDGGAGNDTLLARDATADRWVGCMDGVDRAIVDKPFDLPALERGNGCDWIDAAWTAQPTIVLRSLRLTARRGRLRVPVVCRAPVGARWLAGSRSRRGATASASAARGCASARTPAAP